MRHGEPRLRTQAVTVYAAMAFATVAWWIVLIAYPTSRQWFFGDYASTNFLWLFLVPDSLCALVGATWLALSVKMSWDCAGVLSSIVFGAQGYATMFALGIAVQNPVAYPGAVAMVLSAGACLALALRLNGVSILWGPFQFKPSDRTDVRGHIRASLMQTALMWVVFLGLIPAVISWFERSIGADRWNFEWVGRFPVAGAVFLVGGSLGLFAAYHMCSSGDGTPLPNQCAKRLVVQGPYRYIRNPMALGGIVQGAAVGLAFGSAMIVAYALLGAFWWDVLARPLEEADLESRFHGDYIRYRDEVPCWRFRFKPWQMTRSELG